MPAPKAWFRNVASRLSGVLDRAENPNTENCWEDLDRKLIDLTAFEFSAFIQARANAVPLSALLEEEALETVRSALPHLRSLAASLRDHDRSAAVQHGSTAIAILLDWPPIQDSGTAAPSPQFLPNTSILRPFPVTRGMR